MSLAIDFEVVAENAELSVELPIDSVVVGGGGVRSGGLDEAHVALLMETDGEWPPIVVWGSEHLVLDGVHRVEAARRLGYTRVLAQRFFGTADEAFLESVRRNIDHGLPLSAVDRRRAARRVLTRNPEWSDRRIASLCGLSGKTVARLRRDGRGREGDEGGAARGLERRIGRDGKARPVQPGAVRDRIRRALEDNPEGSLRAIALSAGASPETVRTVRARLSTAEVIRQPAQPTPVEASDAIASPTADPRPERDAPQAAAISSIGPPESPPESHWGSDAALLACGDGGEFARWFARSHVDDDWYPHVWTIPLGRVFEVVDEARRRAGLWTAFASMLEARAR